MIRSMTGSVVRRSQVDGSGFDIEVRSVNHRHLDARVRLPRVCWRVAGAGGAGTASSQRAVQRGKVDMSVTPRRAAPRPRACEIDTRVGAAATSRGGRALRRPSKRLEGSLGRGRPLMALPGVADLIEPEICRRGACATALAPGSRWRPASEGLLK